MRGKLALALLMAALATPVAVRAELPAPDKQSLDIYRQVYGEFLSHHGEPLDHWEHALIIALGKAPPEEAADQLAPRFDLPTSQMRELVRLWLFAQASTDDRTSHQQRELRARFFALISASHRSALVLEAAAASLVTGSHCSGNEFEPLLIGNKHPAEDGWRVVQATTGCVPIYARFAQIVPDRALPALLDLAQEDWLGPKDELPLLAYLTSGPALERIDARHRDAAAKYLTHLYLATLLRAGLIERAITLYELLTPEWKAAMLAETRGESGIIADGLPVVFDKRLDGADTSLAAADAVSGRNIDAEALLHDSQKLATARRILGCRIRQLRRRAASEGRTVRYVAG